jgi:hypothetical protein
MTSLPIEDFGVPTPLEYLAIADRERIHSQFLCWH